MLWYSRMFECSQSRNFKGSTSSLAQEKNICEPGKYGYSRWGTYSFSLTVDRAQESKMFIHIVVVIGALPKDARSLRWNGKWCRGQSNLLWRTCFNSLGLGGHDSLGETEASVQEIGMGIPFFVYFSAWQYGREQPWFRNVQQYPYQ